MTNRSTGRSRGQGAPPSRPEPTPHVHFIPADPGWWAILMLDEEVQALPVISWEFISPDESDEDAGPFAVPSWGGVIHFGHGEWAVADGLKGFADYVYSPGAKPSLDEIRYALERMLERFPDASEDNERFRAWLAKTSR